MKIHNSLSGGEEEFSPVNDRKVTLYVCGLTPYDSAHIGHARTYVAFDVVKRFLQQDGYVVFHIQNITDVEDKIIKRCMESGADPEKLTESVHSEAMEMFAQLHILPADVYPKVTEHIPDIIDFITKIIGNGYAYETGSGVYFDVSKFAGYGSLSGQKMEEIKAGSRKEVDESKDDPADFALWKKTKNAIIEFDSPWGRGRPGWHIECSAMVLRYAKGTLDIHGGARDLVFPHHENEIAQAEAVTGKTFAKYWMHTGFLTVDGEKMSKSLGNFITLREALQRFSANSLRMFFLQAHYRSPVDYDEEAVTDAGGKVERIFNSLGLVQEMLSGDKPSGENPEFRKNTEKHIAGFRRAMENDFDTPGALAELFSLLRLSNAHLREERIDRGQLERVLSEAGRMLGVLGLEEERKGLGPLEGKIRDILSGFGLPQEGGAEEMLQRLIDARDKARKEKDFAKSDLIRAKLSEAGIILEDRDGGVRWKVA